MTHEQGADRVVERHIEVSRSARYWTLGEPAAEHDEVWYVLHGYGQLARRFLRRFECLEAESCLIVAPEALSRFYVSSEARRHGRDALVGATWMTREDRDAEIHDYVAYLDRLAEATLRGDPRVTVLGFSQGVATAWRWITYGCVPGLARLVAWAGVVPPDLDLARAARSLGDAEVVLVTGASDGTVPDEVGRDGEARLRGAAVAFRSLTHPGGHEIDEATLLELARR